MIYRALVAAKVIAILVAIVGWIWASRSLFGKGVPANGASEVRRFAGVAEHHVYVGILIFVATAYAYGAFVSSSHPFGFAKLRHLGAVGTIAAFLLLPGLAFKVARTFRSERVAAWTTTILERKWLIALAIGFVLVALPLRNYWINADGRSWPELFRTKGPEVNLDQILELYVHYLFSVFSLWCGYNFVRIEGLRYKTSILTGLILMGALHSYSWIGAITSRPARDFGRPSHSDVKARAAAALRFRPSQ